METSPSNPLKLMEDYMSRKNYSKKTVESYTYVSSVHLKDISVPSFLAA